MIVLHTKKEIREWVKAQKISGKTVGFVPTMGALHAGHQELFKKAAEFSDVVVASVFVNPTQFGPKEDFSRYPRTLENDIKVAEQMGVSAIFAPNVDEMYSKTHYLSFKIQSLNEYLCGGSRPGHFEGVLQVVLKLFHIVQPDSAFFGKKDIQQCRIIRAMVEEFNIPIQVHFVDTVRESDGLALSSRNRYLTEKERQIAPQFYKGLQEIYESIVAKSNWQQTVNQVKQNLNHDGFRIDYIELVGDADFKPSTAIFPENTYILAGAVFLGTTRLIDNIQFTL